MIRKAFTVWAPYMWVVGVSSKIIWGSNTGNQTRCTETTSDKTCDDEVTTGFLLRSSSLHFSCTTTRWNHWVASEKSEQRCCEFGTQPLFWFLNLSMSNCTGSVKQTNFSLQFKIYQIVKWSKVYLRGFKQQWKGLKLYYIYFMCIINLSFLCWLCVKPLVLGLFPAAGWYYVLTAHKHTHSF